MNRTDKLSEVSTELEIYTHNETKRSEKLWEYIGVVISIIGVVIVIVLALVK